MLNLRGALGADTVRKSDTAINTNPLRCRTNKSEEDLSAAKIYSSVGSQTPIQKPVKKQADSVRKQDADLWRGLMGNL